MIEKERKQGLEILSVLEQEGFEARFAGGCVRDFYLGVDPLDYDIATTAMPEQVLDLFRKREHYRALPTGIEHGTITVIFDRKAFEITSLREDIQTDGRHAKVLFGKSFEKDAARRDFTMNAMYQDRHGTVFDYFQGKSDLDQKKIRFVGDCSVRIQEDYLRILRYFRFQARFNLLGDDKTLKTIQLYADGLKEISRERISQEMKGLFQVCKFKNVFIDMKTSRVLQAVFPGAAWDSIDMERFLFFFEKLDGFIERLCFMCVEVPSLSPEGLFHSLKLTKKHLKKLEACSDGFQAMSSDLSDEQVRILFLWDTLEKKAGPGAGFLVFRVLECAAKTQEQKQWVEQALRIENELGYKRQKNLPVSGNDLSEKLGVQGKDLGDLLLHLRKQFYAESWDSYEDGLKSARQWLDLPERSRY